MSLHLSHCRETPPSYESGHLGVIPLEAENTESLSHTYFCRKASLEVLVKIGLPLQSKTGNHSHPEMIWGAQNIPQAALLKLMILYI